MQTLYSPSSYPAPMQRKLKLLSPLAIEIANRWMLGWPEKVKGLLQTGEYLQALLSQEKQERDALVSATERHLARHEILQMSGLSLRPPTPSVGAAKADRDLMR